MATLLGDHLEDQFEDLLGLWADLECALSMLLRRPLRPLLYPQCCCLNPP